jgi:drug/metabolite transporter (DMT)-like permease
MQCVSDCDTDSPKTFEQPVIQTLQMFIGESGCWLVVFLSFLLKRYSGSSKTQANGGIYQPVGSDDDDVDEEEVENMATSHGSLIDPTNIVAKSLVDEDGVAREKIPLKGMKVCLLALPAICDICGTTLMNAGLLFVAASIYQMTRGALVLFVGLFSVLFLRRHLGAWKWASLFIVVLGVAIVGLAGWLDKKHAPPGLPGDTVPGDDKDLIITRAFIAIRETVKTQKESTAAQTVLGVLMIAGAQIFTAFQFVLEESIVHKYEIGPLEMVGWEGLFGFSVTLIGMGVLHGAIGTGYFNAREAFYEVFTNRAVAGSSVLIMISIG